MTHIPAMKMNNPTATAMHTMRKAVKPAQKQNHIPPYSIFICCEKYNNKLHTYILAGFVAVMTMKLQPSLINKKPWWHLLCDTGMIADKIEPANNTGTYNINIIRNKWKLHIIYLLSSAPPAAVTVYITHSLEW